MLLQRLLVTILLLPLGLAVIALGGPAYAAVVTLFLLVAGWEYVHLFRAGGHHPASVLVVGGVLILAADRYLNQFNVTGVLISLLVLVSMAYHLVAYERGRDQAATDFAITLGGILYIGWLGAYLISLRELPEGKWWVLVVLPAVWLADSGAYFVGRRFGRRPFSPRLSPKKTWEGYLAGVVTGTLGAALLSAVWRIGAGPESFVTLARGALLGVCLAVITPLGDLGESMIKRQFGVKDSGHIFPGHGGALDRIDSWLWGGVIGYYLILALLSLA